MLSIYEIADKLSLSTATVSRAFDPRFADKVRAETRKKIYALCDKENYRPSFNGRSFSTGQTFKLGVILDSMEKDLGSPLLGLCMRGLCRTAQAHDYAVTFLYAGGEGGSSKRVAEFLKSAVCDGYTFGTGMVDDLVMKAIGNCGRPTVAMNTQIALDASVSTVFRDFLPAYREVWSKIPEEVRRNTAFVHWGNAKEKLRAIRATAPAGAHVDTVDLGVSSHGFCSDWRNSRMRAAQHLEKLKHYQMLWVASDLMAFGVSDVLRENGIEPGKDILLVGFDNLEGTLKEFDTEFLSTIDPEWDQFGSVLAELLIRQITAKGAEPCRIGIPAKFVRRTSL